MRIALGLEYNGRAFCGWQSQSSRTAIQDVVEKALAQVADAPVATVCAGRTDAGVHAMLQVIHFDTQVVRSESAWVRGTNTHLPATVSVNWAVPVDDQFHARFSAITRRYRYVLWNAAVRPALLDGLVGWYHRPLDVAAMCAAARYLVGQHDFSAFRSSECQAKSPVRNLMSLEISERDGFILFDLQANAFLHHMVRNLVGSLIYVGNGRHAPEWLLEVLEGRNRAKAAPTFQAAGLYLVGIDYGPRWNLPTVGRMMPPFLT